MAESLNILEDHLVGVSMIH